MSKQKKHSALNKGFHTLHAFAAFKSAFHLYTLGILSICLLLAQDSRAQNYNTRGSAYNLSGTDCYKLTNAGTRNSNGAVWYTDKLDLSRDFTINLTMNFGNQDENGADGIVFVMQTVGNMALGNTGGGMGFEGFSPSFGIEFDTYRNGTEPTYDHIAFLRDGNVFHNNSRHIAGPVQMSASSANTEDNLDHQVKIVWNKAAGTLAVYFDCSLRISQKVDLKAILGNNNSVYWGFTAGTGSLTNNQTVCLKKDIFVKDSFSVCNGQQVQISAGQSADNRYTWTPAVNISNASVQKPFVYPKSSGYYTATYKNNCNETVNDSIWINVLPVNKPTLGKDTFFCGPFTHRLNAGKPGLKYVWNTGDTGAVLQISKGGTYIVRSSDNICSASDTILISNDIEKLNLGRDSAFCNSQFTPFNLNAPQGFVRYLWNDGSGQYFLRITEPGLYHVQVENNRGCKFSDSIRYTLSPAPLVQMNDTQICPGSSVILDGSNRNTAITSSIAYLWNTGARTPGLSVNSAGQFIVELRYLNCSVSDTVQVELLDRKPDLGNDTFFCGPFTFTLKTPGIFSNYRWHDGSSAAEHTTNSSGTKYLKTVSIEGCTASDSITILQHPPADAGLGRDTVICYSATLLLSAADGMLSYRWSNGSVTRSTEIKQPGTYAVTVQDRLKCISSDTIQILQNKSLLPSEMYMPDAFSPNGDELNDWFPGNGYKDPGSDYLLSVYNRWGEQIFSSSNPDIQWDGRHKEQEAPQDVYLFLVKYKGCDGDIRMFRGSFSLIR